jgi:hypothetical protein
MRRCPTNLDVSDHDSWIRLRHVRSECQPKVILAFLLFVLLGKCFFFSPWTYGVKRRKRMALSLALFSECAWEGLMVSGLAPVLRFDANICQIPSVSRLINNPSVRCPRVSPVPSFDVQKCHLRSSART